MYSEKIVVGQGTEFPLNGLLTLTDGTAGPAPAVVMVHGSGSSNMDEKVMKLTPFRDLAESLIMMAGSPYHLEDIMARQFGQVLMDIKSIKSV